ncbi:MAG: 16S rRNA (uracil(1498)-N(3))-methyltransferase [Desulfuromonadales bacterium]|nr:16S rRNA (uracil(1498)-N(3))-methyltransferase [Desulfuromonadales bacterium]
MPLKAAAGQNRRGPSPGSPASGAPPLQVELVQGTAKGDKLELVLQKGTELGVNHFIICPTERSIGRFKQDRLPGKAERWQRIIQEAARQCGQSFLPALTIVESLGDALSACSGEQRLVLWEQAETPLPSLLEGKKPATVSLLVGPEGGLTENEVELAHSSGFNNVRLGPRILRTETAGLAIVSILQYLYGDLASGAGAV